MKLPLVPIPDTNPPKANPAHPRARPLVTTEFTITCDPASCALQGIQKDVAAIVWSLQTSIRQAYAESNPSVTLLSGRWSSQLSSNFVLTFAGNPSIDEIFRLRGTLLSPFQPGASLVPQWGFTCIILHSVPVVRTNGFLPSSEELTAELGLNPVCQNLCIISPPKWICASIEPEKHHSSVLFTIVDKLGAALARILWDPPFLYGAQSVAELFNSLPLARQCDRCFCLGHSVERCRFSKNTIICPLCGGSHKAKDHAQRCPTIKNHTGMFCICPPLCINCHGAKLPVVGHIARDLSCPLCKKYRRADNHAGEPSKVESNRQTGVGSTTPLAVIPSSQPDGNDDTGPLGFQWLSDRPVPPALMSFFAAQEKWMSMDFNTMTITELLNLPDLARAAAISHGIKIPDIIHTKSSNLIANEQVKSVPNV